MFSSFHHNILAIVLSNPLHVSVDTGNLQGILNRIFYLIYNFGGMVAVSSISGLGSMDSAETGLAMSDQC